MNAAIVFGTESQVPDTIVALGPDQLEESATHEMALGWRGMFGHVPRVTQSGKPSLAGAAENIVVVGTQAQVRASKPSLAAGLILGPDAYRLLRSGHILLIEGGDARGVLYGTFALLREVAEQHSLQTLDKTSTPWGVIRWTNSVTEARHSFLKTARCAPIFRAPPRTRDCWLRWALTAAPSTTSMRIHAFCCPIT